MQYLLAFVTGGAICAACQLLIDKTNLTPARILTGCVVLGVILTGAGIYEPFVRFAGAGATVPILGFGYSLARGVEQAVERSGLLGAFTGGFTATSAGVEAAVIFGVLASLLFKPTQK
ncbi:MAG: stage V sporulation protein AE [Clostridia bacterium]|nr:stage V sporulation protein AE [Clostridia bacterium]